MAVRRWTPLVAAVVVFLGFCLFTIVQSTEIDDLRLTRNNGTVARFVVPRPFLEDELDRLGLSGKVELLSSSMYESCEGEISLHLQTTVDMTLPQELPLESVDHVTSDGKYVSFGLSVIASDGSHSVIMLAYFSDASTLFVPPYLTSVQSVKHVESIEFGDGFVTLRHGCDVMNVVVDHKEGCHDDADVGEDFDVVTGEDVHLSNFPAGFDWGCDTLGSNISFCKRLEPFVDEIDEADGDVCITMSTSKSKRCPASVRVEKMTGVFREALPFFADMVPVESFEAEYIDREHAIGIVFPCF